MGASKPVSSFSVTIRVLRHRAGFEEGATQLLLLVLAEVVFRDLRGVVVRERINHPRRVLGQILAECLFLESARFGVVGQAVAVTDGWSSVAVHFGLTGLCWC